MSFLDNQAGLYGGTVVWFSPLDGGRGRGMARPPGRRGGGFTFKTKGGEAQYTNEGGVLGRGGGSHPYRGGSALRRRVGVREGRGFISWV